MAQLPIRQAGLFGAKQNCYGSGPQLPQDFSSCLVKDMNVVLEFAMSDRRCADHHDAIGDSFCERIKFSSSCQQRLSPDCGDSVAVSFFVRRNQPEMRDAEVAHGTRNGSDIERIAWAHQNEAKVFEADMLVQGAAILRCEEPDCHRACPPLAGYKSALGTKEMAGA